MFEENDFLYLLDERGRRYWISLRRGMMKIKGLGVIDGDRIMACQDGSRITIAGKDFWVLRPGTVELMTSLDRGAQVITPKDAGTILLHLDLKCGDLVLEGGVGSGSLTVALIRAVQPRGRVISVENREDFAERARKNLSRAGLECWELRMDDVRKVELDESVDAVVLDIPDPWEAVDRVTRLLRPGGRFCAYVPNTNQLEKTVSTLRLFNFVEIQCLENLQREMEVHPGGVRPAFQMLGHTGYMVFARLTAHDETG